MNRQEGRALLTRSKVRLDGKVQRFSHKLLTDLLLSAHSPANDDFDGWAA